MLYVHGNVSHGGSIDVIEPSHQRSIKTLAVLKTTDIYGSLLHIA